MRFLLRAAGSLVILAGLQLFVFSEDTDRFFSWTVEPPLTAAFMGAAYFASSLVEWQAANRRHWADAHIAVPAVFVFTTLTMIVTLIHLDRFHLGSEFETITRAATWFWLFVYAVVPVVMAVVWYRQVKAPGGDPPPGPGLVPWLRAVVTVQALAMGLAGLALLLFPVAAAPIWPWDLTPLTGRAVGAWLLSLAVVAVHAVRENSYRRVRPAAWAFVAFGLLEFVALYRYADTMDWTAPQGIALVVLFASTLVAGGAALAAGSGEAEAT